jgi:DNA-binding CsgD family transcriptional regulator
MSEEIILAIVLFSTSIAAAKSRKPELVSDRKACCFCLWKIGFTQQQIAEKLNTTQQAVAFHIKTYSK